ncbi:MAG TPA: sigma-70 family RNA polymerase sigma factor [Phycisphaerae bacterium]|nr:sigma-70 family RNA polymerase sigma factor [Phycisphaerae bacterium]
MGEDVANSISQAVAGDAEALRGLLVRFGRQVWAEVHRDIDAKHRAIIDADDVMQVTYLEAFLQVGRLTARDEAGLVAWLRRIAQNNLRDAVKEQGRQKRPPAEMRVHRPARGDSSYITLVEHLGATTATPSRHVAADEASRCIEAALTRLPEDYARVVRAYDLDGGSIADVAKALNRSTGAVHMLRARAHDRLRVLLGAETDFFSQVE